MSLGMASADLSIIYSRYLEALNSRDIESLGTFVHEASLRNGEPMSLQGYKNMIRNDVAAIPDLQFIPHTLVISKDQVACRLVYKCTPVGDFMGYKPTGKQIEFSEHVFYRFEDAKIKEVWAMIDRAAVREQLTAS